MQSFETLVRRPEGDLRPSALRDIINGECTAEDCHLGNPCCQNLAPCNAAEDVACAIVVGLTENDSCPDGEVCIEHGNACCLLPV